MAKKKTTTNPKTKAADSGEEGSGIQYDFAIPCKFAGVSGNKNSASIGVAFEDGDISLSRMAKLFRNSQLQMRLTAKLNGDEDDPNQGILPMGGDPEKDDVAHVSTEVIAEVSGFSVKTHGYGISLHMNDGAVDIKSLWRFRAKPGVMHVKRLGAPDKNKGRDSIDTPQDEDEVNE